jgi:signal transduction histidine kinase
MRAAGLPVQLAVTGPAREIPARLDLAAYRIVQEALTNSLRHSDRSGTEVSVHYGEDELTVEVVDASPPAAVGRPGRGLVGMRERATLLGGRVDAGAEPGRGFAVRAHLPWPVEAA